MEESTKFIVGLVAFIITISTIGATYITCSNKAYREKLEEYKKEYRRLSSLQQQSVIYPRKIIREINKDSLNKINDDSLQNILFRIPYGKDLEVLLKETEEDTNKNIY